MPVYDPFAHAPQVSRESRIAAELERFTGRHGFTVIDNVVFNRGLVSATVDHVLIDRFGLMLIDAELYEGAYVQGGDTDNLWSATYPDGRTEEFRNPLYLSTGNENVVKQVLAAKGIKLDASQIRSAVVFDGADTSRLNLVEVSAAKVKSAAQVGEIVDARYGFPPNNGQLTQADLARITGEVRALSRALPSDGAALAADEDAPWSSDPAVVAAAARMSVVAPPPPMRPDQETFRRTAELSGHHSGGSGGPSLRSALLTLGTIVVIVLTLIAGSLFFPQLQAGSTLAWTVAFVLLVAIAQLVASNIAAARKQPSPRHPGWLVAAFALRVLVVGVFVGGLWLLIAGGAADSLGEMLASKFASRSPGVTKPVKAPTNPGVIVAKRRLREIRPDVYKTATNLNSPKITPEPDARTAYTWQYSAAGSSTPLSFTLTIDLQGKVVSP